MRIRAAVKVIAEILRSVSSGSTCRKGAILSVVLLLVIAGRVPAQDSPFPGDVEASRLKVGEFLIKSDSTSSKNVVDFGIIVVPENREQHNARNFHLPFVRYRALQDNAHPPVFLLTGGPSSSNLGVDLPEVFYTHNDLVKIGYRGVDGDVKLKCPEMGKALTVDNPVSVDGIDHIRKAMRASYDRLLSEDVDPEADNMIAVVDDLDAIRSALGYSRVNLFSTSYGSQVAYLYCARYSQCAYRSLMVGASSRGRQFVYDQLMVEKQLSDYNAVWLSDSEAAARSADIVQTMRNVQSSLPPEWNAIPIDGDKLKMVTFYLL